MQKSGTNLNDVERRIYKMRRNSAKTDTSEVRYGDNFENVEEDYYNVYNDYLVNLILNLITYENAPETLDERYLEFCLRYYGYARVAATDRDNVFVLGQSTGLNSVSNMSLAINNIGNLVDAPTINNPYSLNKDDKLNYITRVNYKSLDNGYITISNKYNYYLSGIFTVAQDFDVIDRVAKTLAKIKASQLANIDMMKQPYVGFTKDKNLTARNIFTQLQQGSKFINVDADLGSIRDVIDVVDFNVKDYLQTLKQAWNNEINELLTMLGINTIGIDKKERLLANEADSNAQLTEASANVYLQARNQQLSLLNNVLGTNIKATFNQQAYKDLVQLKDNDEQNTEVEDNGNGNDEQNDEEQD